MNYEQLKAMYKKCDKKDINIIKWNGGMLFKWEFNFLKRIGAISDTSIKQEYPVLKVRTSKEDKTFDLEGDLEKLEIKKQEINQNYKDSSATIEYTPKTYTIYKNILRDMSDEEIKEKRATQYNTVPVVSEY